MKRIIFLLIALAFLAGGGYFFSEYNRGLEGAGKTEHTLTSAALFSAFEDDEKAANAKYLDKVVEVDGTITEVGKNKQGKITISLEGGMLFGTTCEMFESEKLDQSKFKKGQKIKLKGICTGFLSDVVLVRCVEAK